MSGDEPIAALRSARGGGVGPGRESEAAMIVSGGMRRWLVVMAVVVVSLLVGGVIGYWLPVPLMRVVQRISGLEAKRQETNGDE